MSVLWTAVAAVSLVLLLVAHEAAHALALRKHGIPISEAGLGMPFAPRLQFKPTRRRPFTLSLSIWLIMAYVMPDPAHEKRIEALGYRDKTWFYGAGVVANGVIFTGLVSVINLVQGAWVRAVVWAGITAALWVGRRWFVSYAMPVLAIPAFVFVAWGLMKTVGEPAGVVGTARYLAVSTPMDAVKIVCLISLSLAIMNMLPIYPLDGGKICGEVVRRWTGERGEKVFQIVGGTLVVALLLYVTGSDLLWLLFS